jgi:thymidylate synthase
MWMQRSVDAGLGLPFNILSYSILTYMLAQCVNMTCGEVMCSLGYVHVYENHIQGLSEQLSRNPNTYKLPKLILNKDIKNINDFTFDDIKIENYESFPSIKLPLSVGG